MTHSVRHNNDCSLAQLRDHLAMKRDEHASLAIELDELGPHAEWTKTGPMKRSKLALKDEIVGIERDIGLIEAEAKRRGLSGPFARSVLNALRDAVRLVGTLGRSTPEAAAV